MLIQVPVMTTIYLRVYRLKRVFELYENYLKTMRLTLGSSIVKRDESDVIAQCSYAHRYSVLARSPREVSASDLASCLTGEKGPQPRNSDEALKSQRCPTVVTEKEESPALRLSTHNSGSKKAFDDSKLSIQGIREEEVDENHILDHSQESKDINQSLMKQAKKFDDEPSPRERKLLKSQRLRQASAKYFAAQ